MPRSTNSIRTALTAPSISLLPASLVQFHAEHNSGGGNSKAALSRRRHVLKHVPQLETAGVQPEETSSQLSSSSSPSPSPTSSIAANLGEFGAKVGSSLPVVRAGATFLSTLHASVALSASLHPPSNPASAPPSPCLFPQFIPLVPTATSVGRRLSDSMASETTVSPAAVPPLDFVVATEESDRIEGVKLVADSIAQKRQLASFAMMTHPYFFGIMGVAFSMVYQYMYKRPDDWPLIMTTSVGILMAGFVAIRGAVGGFLELAESINYTWLDNDEVVVAHWGEGADRKVIGSVVYKLEKANGSGNGRKGKKIAKIRAWTTKQRQRGHGVGKGLIEETVRQAKAHGADDVRYEEGNIYEKRLIPKWANSGFEEGLKAARAKLEGYIAEYQGKK